MRADSKLCAMKILVTGANGQLGYDVVKTLASRSIPHKGVDVNDFDITNQNVVFSVIKAYQPTAIIHCSAFTAVGKAEEEPERCIEVNEEGTRNVAQACNCVSAKMIFISTDYVFSGEKDGFYVPEDVPNPLSVYGKSKLNGEEIVKSILDEFFIVRTSWAFGEHGNNFVKTMLRQGRERSCISVVTDQKGSPTYTADLAPLLCEMSASKKYGLYHATNEGFCSWAEFAEEIYRLSAINVDVRHITSSEYPSKVKRPLNSCLDKACLDVAEFNRLPHWKNALQRFLNVIEI